MMAVIQKNLCVDGMVPIQANHKTELPQELSSPFKDMFFPCIEGEAAAHDSQGNLLYNPETLNSFDSSLFLTYFSEGKQETENTLQHVMGPIIRHAEGDFEKEVFGQENVCAFVFKENLLKEEEKNFDSTRVKQSDDRLVHAEELSPLPEAVSSPPLVLPNLSLDQKDPIEALTVHNEKKKEATPAARTDVYHLLKGEKEGQPLTHSSAHLSIYEKQGRAGMADSSTPAYFVEKIAAPLSFKPIESENRVLLGGGDHFKENPQNFQNSQISQLKKGDVNQLAQADNYPFLSANNFKADQKIIGVQDTFISSTSGAGDAAAVGFAKSHNHHGKITESSHPVVFDSPASKEFYKVFPVNSPLGGEAPHDSAFDPSILESGSFLPIMSDFSSHKAGDLNENIVVSQPVNGADLMETLKHHVSGPHKKGETHLNVQLHPQELGALTIRIHIDDYGQANVHFMSENQAAHEALIHYRQNILEIFDQAALSLDVGNLNFSMGQDRQWAGAQEPRKSKAKDPNFSALSAPSSQKVLLSSNGHSLVDIHA